MKKYNKRGMAFYQKYGDTMEDTLFAKKTTAEVSPPTPPLVVDDATEEKAMVFESLSTEEQRKRVLEAYRQLQPATDNDVARALRIVPSTVAARRNDNIDMGLMVPVLDEHNRKLKKLDRVTRKPNVLWKVRA